MIIGSGSVMTVKSTTMLEAANASEYFVVIVQRLSPSMSHISPEWGAHKTATETTLNKQSTVNTGMVIHTKLRSHITGRNARR